MLGDDEMFYVTMEKEVPSYFCESGFDQHEKGEHVAVHVMIESRD